MKGAVEPRSLFSRRTALSEVENALTVELARARARGPVIDLTASNPTRAGIPYDEAAIAAALGSARSLTYEPRAFGLDEARAAVAEHLAAEAAPAPPERVVLTASTSEAYAVLFKVLCDPGDAVLVPAPSYPLLEHLAAFEGVRLVPYPLAYDGRWHVDVPVLRARAAGGAARAIVVVSPNNPTGNYLARAELEAMLDLGLPVISDEVFGPYPLRDDPARAPSALVADRGLVFALSGLSKACGLPQMKLGWIAVGGEAALAEAALARLELVCDAMLSVGAPVMVAARDLFAAAAPSRGAIRARARENLGRLRAALAGSAASVLDAEGGWYAVVRLPATRPEEAWALGLLREHAVYTHPGHFFDFADEPYVVVSLLTEPEVLAAGAAALARAAAG
ncbi:MAG: pyridoxal phosphate-dependent aminotransferase [Myxococcales bacterium]|nr:pyridoxal phosphate-dependent aminotransferase [Myxococcales bacterium]